MTNPELICRYIGRYTKRLVIAQSRIVDYDGTFVTLNLFGKNSSFNLFNIFLSLWFINPLIEAV